MGRASEASTWMRVYDRLADRARAHVMADLPDLAPPRLESHREPLMLVAADETNVNDLEMLPESSDVETQLLDSLHPVFSESNPPSEFLLLLGEGGSRSETDEGRV